MPSRSELNIRAHAVGLDQTAFPNDSKLEQKVLWLEKNATAQTGVIATTTLTSDATTVSDADTVTLGSKVYTFKTTLSEAFATSTLTSDATAPSDGETFSIEGITYTFKTTLDVPAQAYQVLIGVSAAVALDNVKSAINADGTTGVYSAGTVAHPRVTATTNTNTTQLIQAIVLGVTGNNYLTAETSAHLSWTGSSLAGGVDPVVNQVLIGVSAATNLSNLKAAIEGTATAGTNYSTNTVKHVQVTGSTLTSTTLLINSRDFDILNAAIPTSTTAAHLSFTSTVMVNGVSKVIAASAVDNGGVAGDAYHFGG